MRRAPWRPPPMRPSGTRTRSPGWGPSSVLASADLREPSWRPWGCRQPLLRNGCGRLTRWPSRRRLTARFVPNRQRSAPPRGRVRWLLLVRCWPKQSSDRMAGSAALQPRADVEVDRCFRPAGAPTLGRGAPRFEPSACKKAASTRSPVWRRGVPARLAAQAWSSPKPGRARRAPERCPCICKLWSRTQHGENRDTRTGSTLL
jgi:hypothetical protein